GGCMEPWLVRRLMAVAAAHGAQPVPIQTALHPIEVRAAVIALQGRVSSRMAIHAARVHEDRAGRCEGLAGSGVIPLHRLARCPLCCAGDLRCDADQWEQAEGPQCGEGSSNHQQTSRVGSRSMSRHHASPSTVAQGAAYAPFSPLTDVVLGYNSAGARD